MAAKRKENGNKIGGWAFLIGVLIAVLFGLFGAVSTSIAVILVVIGIVVGLLNIADKEATPFLLSGAVLIIASSLGSSGFEVIPMLNSVLQASLLIFVPATVVVAIRNVFMLARN